MRVTDEVSEPGVSVGLHGADGKFLNVNWVSRGVVPGLRISKRCQPIRPLFHSIEWIVVASGRPVDQAMPKEARKLAPVAQRTATPAPRSVMLVRRRRVGGGFVGVGEGIDVLLMGKEVR